MSGAGLCELALTQLEVDALCWRYGQVDGRLHTWAETGAHFGLDWVRLAFLESRLLP